MDLMERIIDLSQQGYLCSQVLGKLLLETVGTENTKLVQALGGLCGGVGYTQGCCGCMTAGCCVISYFTGKAEDSEPMSPEHRQALTEFTDWFKNELMAEYGGTDCTNVLHGDLGKRLEFCPPLIAETYIKCMEILQEHGLI